VELETKAQIAQKARAGVMVKKKKQKNSNGKRGRKLTKQEREVTPSGGKNKTVQDQGHGGGQNISKPVKKKKRTSREKKSNPKERKKEGFWKGGGKTERGTQNCDGQPSQAKERGKKNRKKGGSASKKKSTKGRKKKTEWPGGKRPLWACSLPGRKEKQKKKRGNRGTGSGGEERVPNPSGKGGGAVSRVTPIPTTFGKKGRRSSTG